MIRSRVRVVAAHRPRRLGRAASVRTARLLPCSSDAKSPRARSGEGRACRSLTRISATCEALSRLRVRDVHLQAATDPLLAGWGTDRIAAPLTTDNRCSTSTSPWQPSGSAASGGARHWSMLSSGTADLSSRTRWLLSCTSGEGVGYDGGRMMAASSFCRVGERPRVPLVMAQTHAPSRTKACTYVRAVRRRSQSVKQTPNATQAGLPLRLLVASMLDKHFREFSDELVNYLGRRQTCRGVRMNDPWQAEVSHVEGRTRPDPLSRSGTTSSDPPALPDHGRID